MFKIIFWALLICWTTFFFCFQEKKNLYFFKVFEPNLTFIMLCREEISPSSSKVFSRIKWEIFFSLSLFKLLFHIWASHFGGKRASLKINKKKTDWMKTWIKKMSLVFILFIKFSSVFSLQLSTKRFELEPLKTQKLQYFDKGRCSVISLLSVFQIL